MSHLTLTPYNDNMFTVHDNHGLHVGNLKRVGMVWKFKAIGYGPHGEIMPGHGPLTAQHNVVVTTPDAQTLHAALH